MFATLIAKAPALRQRLSREVVAALIGGVGAAVLGVVVLARTRAYLVAFLNTPAPFPGSRYSQWIAIFLLVGFAPALTATLRPATPRAHGPTGRRRRRERRQWQATAAGSIAFIAVFVVNLGTFRPAEQYQKLWSTGVQSYVGQTVTVLSKGCGKGLRPNPQAMPTSLSPQIHAA